MTSTTFSGRTYALDFDFLESSSTSTVSSPSSTTSNSPQTATKKPRTRRKRLYQTYNEAATLLSAAHPNLFPTKNLKKLPTKFAKPEITENQTNDYSEVLLFPFRNKDASSFLVKNKPTCQTELNSVFSVQEKPRELGFFGVVNSLNCHELDDEALDCESILDEEIEEGIDSIIGSRVADNDGYGSYCHVSQPWFGFGGKFGWAGALRHVEYGNLWSFPAVDVFEISPGMKNVPPVDSVPATEKKKKRKKKEVLDVEWRESSQGLSLKLNYDNVRNAWSGSPFARNCSGSCSPGNGVTVRLLSSAGYKKSKKQLN